MTLHQKLFSLIIGALFCLQISACTDKDANKDSTSNQSAITQSTGQSSPMRSTANEPISPNIFVQLAKKVVPSVVNISTTSKVKSPLIQGAPDDLFRKFFEDFFGPGWGFNWEEGAPFDEDSSQKFKRRRNPPGPNMVPKAVSLGTGFIIDSKGLILTNNHVVANADEIKITFTEAPDERPTDGEVVGRDPELDVALIKVKSKREMVPLELGDSDSLEVGEYVMAVGNPFGQGHSVTHGIISAKGRIAPNFPLATYLQTDAPINPGNSGGPLLNLKGQVIGINNAIDIRAQGIGFAIPISTVKRSLDQLKNKGVVERGYVGVLVGELTPEVADQIGAPKDLRAPFVTSVTPGEPADRAGIKPYDIILEVNGKKVRNSSELVAAITAVQVGDNAKLKIHRDGKEKEFEVKVGKRPTEVVSQGPVKKDKGAKIPTGMNLETLTLDKARQLGITGKPSGALVTAVEFGGPADKAGLARGDVIIEVDRKPILNVDDFYSIVKQKKSYLLRVRKNNPMGGGADMFAVVVLNLRGDEEE